MSDVLTREEFESGGTWESEEFNTYAEYLTYSEVRAERWSMHALEGINNRLANYEAMVEGSALLALVLLAIRGLDSL